MAYVAGECWGHLLHASNDHERFTFILNIDIWRVYVILSIGTGF